MNEQEAEQMATEMWELARKSHWCQRACFPISLSGATSGPQIKCTFRSHGMDSSRRGLGRVNRWLAPGATQERKKQVKHERKPGINPAVGNGL
jgi:hypothetical protein